MEKKMPKYRKKPVVIEAVQLRWGNWNDVCELADVGELKGGKPQGCYIGDDGEALPEGWTSDTLGLHIPTLEGLMLARQGDWIIRGVQGEIYPCKPDIFEATYEPAEDDQ
jgi:hypothetical protein